LPAADVLHMYLLMYSTYTLCTSSHCTAGHHHLQVLPEVREALPERCERLPTGKPMHRVILHEVSDHTIITQTSHCHHTASHSDHTRGPGVSGRWWTPVAQSSADYSSLFKSAHVSFNVPSCSQFLPRVVDARHNIPGHYSTFLR
jgi:hypothetical protein